MSDERKKIKNQITVGESPWGFGNVTGNFVAEKFEGSPLLDTHVELTVTPFCITWEHRQKMLEEIAAVIAKFQI